VFDDLPSYRPDKVSPLAGGRVHPLAANESPHEPLPGIVEAVARAAATVNRYPDFAAAELVARLADTYKVSQDRVALGAGSVALLQMLLQSVGELGTEVVYAWRSFELYPILADLAGVRSVRVPLRHGYHHLDAMADRITDRTRLVIICNPNNPTGTVLPRAQLEAFLARVPPDCLVVLDEAYFEYVRGHCTVSGLSLAPSWPNLVVLRTFSKAYGLAGLRVGYLIGDPGVVTQLRKTCLPYSLSAVAQAAANAALQLQDQLLQRVDQVVAQRSRMHQALLDAGWDITSSEANFLWLPLRDHAEAFGRWCAERGIAVRTFTGEGVRASVGTTDDNDAFLTAAANWCTAG
jgi:histidinol-phosphate aminotransferase